MDLMTVEVRSPEIIEFPVRADPYNVITEFCVFDVESPYNVILDSLCKSLDKAEGKWLEKLPRVHWAYRTTKRVSTSKTPFCLACGTEATIPVDVSVPTLRVKRVVQDLNDALVDNFKRQNLK